MRNNSRRNGSGTGSRRRWLTAALVAGAFAVPATGAPPPYRFTAIDPPGSVFTQAFGINERGDVVGMWRDTAGVTRGFVQRDGAFETVVVPGAVLTQVRAINAQGDIVGSYRLPGEPAVGFHGFFRGREDVFVTLDHPGARYTILQRILDDGTIVGCLHGNDMTGTMFGFLRQPDGSLVDFALPASMHNGATPDGRLVIGHYTDLAAAKTYGYLVEGGEVRAWQVPGSGWTEAWDVNARREIVGNFGGVGLATRAYVLRDGEFTALAAPRATATFAYGVNAWGGVVGRYVDPAGRHHGYLATPRPPWSIGRALRVE